MSNNNNNPTRRQSERAQHARAIRRALRLFLNMTPANQRAALQKMRDMKLARGR